MRQKSGWSKDLLYHLVESIKEYAIFACDTEGRVVGWNIGAEKIFGFSPEEIIGRESDVLFTAEDRLAGVPEHERQTAVEQGFSADERWHNRKDETVFFASGIQTALFDDDGNHTGFAKICRDLTERLDLQKTIDTIQESLEGKIVERTVVLTKSNEELRQEIIARRRTEEIRLALLRKIVITQENERKRIAREIHDSIGQQMTAFKLRLNAVVTGAGIPDALRREIGELQTMANRIDDEVEFIAWELRPSVLDDLGLPIAAKRFVRDWAEHFQIRGDFREVGVREQRFSPEVEINLYRIVQEALNNTAKYAKASRGSVMIEKSQTSIRLIVEDDGVGFDTDLIPVGRPNYRGLGIVGMRERAELLGGTLEIESQPGKGTTIFVRVPLEPNQLEPV